MPDPTQAPAALGFRMPAEWEPQEAVWLSWPHRRATWPGAFRPIPAVFARIAAEVSLRQKVRINAAPSLFARARARIRSAGARMENVEFYPNPTNDAWCRDHGPIFVRNDRTGEVAVTHWRYNSWGGKYPPFDRDGRIPARVARALRLRRFASRCVLEGGSIDVNGRGLLLTTESCLLNPNRNPGMSREDLESVLGSMLGVSRVIWLGEGIAGDDTDGHVDDLTRFVGDEAVVTAVEKNTRDINHGPLLENLERLRSVRAPSGRRLRVVELPMPAPVRFRRVRLPASYANFLVVNGAVLMPSFRQARSDREAAEVLAHCFPGRQVVPVDCLELVWGLGTLHCVSQQQPASRP